MVLAAVDKTKDDTPVEQGLIQPLSERELDVLRLLGTDLDGEPATANPRCVVHDP